MRLANAVASIILLSAAADVGARSKVRITPSTGDALYSQSTDPNCLQLNAQADDSLPRNVVRLHATSAVGLPDTIRYEWSPPEPEIGVFAADLPLDTNQTTFALRSMSSEYGNQCQIRNEQLPFYNQPTILWIAPTCDSLPDGTSTPFRGDTVTFRVKASMKKRTLGKGAVKVGYGRVGSITMYVDEQDGVGRTTPIPTGLNPFLSARVMPLAGLPPVTSISIDDGNGGTTESKPGDCANFSYDACAFPFYDTTSKFRPTATAELADGSALCDANTLAVQSAENHARIQVETTPRLATYVPGDPRKGRVTVKVTLFDDSLPPNGGIVFQRNALPLTCSTDITIGKLKDSRTTSFDFRHCSVTTSQPCDNDGECPPFETCLVGPHCATTVKQACESNVDCTCDKLCPLAEDPAACGQSCSDEDCIHVLSLTEFDLRKLHRGGSIQLYEATVDLVNLFAANADIVDTWTVTPFNAAAASGTVKYRIKKPKNAAHERR